jgi:HSP20 family protein
MEVNMTLIKFEPLREIETLHDRIQRYFDDFPTFGLNIPDSFSPKIDISEEKEKVNVVAEIPGVKKDNIKITLQDNILTIEGEKKNEIEKKDKNFYRSERVFGSFKRCFTLPADVDSEKVEAKFEDGMLHVSLKKLEPKIKSEKVIELK